MLSDSIAAHLHAALTEAIRNERSVSYSPAALVDATGVGRLDIWDVAEIAAEAVEMHRAATTHWCAYCGQRHGPNQGRFPLEGCPDPETEP